MKTFSLLLFVGLGLATVALINAFPANKKGVMTSDIIIATIDGVLFCDLMECPDDGVRCTVVRKTTADLTNIVSVRKCYDKDDVIVKHQTRRFDNPFPDIAVEDHEEGMKDIDHQNECANCSGTVHSADDLLLMHIKAFAKNYFETVVRQMQQNPDEQEQGQNEN